MKPAIVTRVPRNPAALLPPGRTCRLPNGLQLHYVSRLDVDFLWKEVRQDTVHLQHGIHIAPGDVVLDVGANIGLFAHYAAELVGTEVGFLRTMPAMGTCC